MPPHNVAPARVKVAVYTNREIEKMLLLLRQRYNELLDMKADITAEEIKNTFQGIATAQATLLGLFREHNEEYALRVGVNRKENSSTNTGTPITMSPDTLRTNTKCPIFR